ncbi:hypothetical protein KY290_030022 [Solanum tuberosum]|uniref:Protein kinase domain-containing protein n=1 Tax=Solanum tuberosum TaxID=4113 RepID=A0ABQ7UQI0_SOLTU|nr:PREDICTED: probable LRR receptor-like serine/threonine-protein kinase At1g74360 [Solanum tuberosum]KAH0667911.1 hypothetical protein KY285_029117 [Solanum tuberosum]KAH0750790.1 hypothetical protein KY290_030022 [Solanum tuberosum]
MAEADGVGAFLHNLGNLDSGLFYYQMDNIRSSHMVKIGRLDPAEVIRTLKPTLKRYDGKGVPFQGLNVGNAKNLSYDVLEKITNKFCSENFIQEVRHGRLFRGFIDAGQEGQREVTVKTWDFVFPGVHSYDTYPRKFRDEIILLERSEIKSHPFLVELFGFCFEKKLAVVYDLKFNTPLCELLTSAEFGWKERMKVATDYALLLKTLSREQFDLSCNGSEDIIIIDKEYNIKLVDFNLYAFPQTLGIRYSATTSDNTFIPKAYAFELGVLLLELITKKERAWKSERHAGYYISKMNQSSIVAESFEIDADTGTTITQLIQSCVNHVDERPDIDTVFDKLVSITGYRPAVSDSYPWIDSL